MPTIIYLLLFFVALTLLSSKFYVNATKTFFQFKIVFCGKVCILKCIYRGAYIEDFKSVTKAIDICCIGRKKNL